uniref:Carbonic anhydrase n=1 Tax=Chelydra serpentina TaxID=8475 RepID=A0A8C3XUF1_CHESE
PSPMGLDPPLHSLFSGPHGQAHWSDDYPDCGGQAQSPIDIQTKSVQHDPALPPIEPQGYRGPEDGAFTLLNNGHTVAMSLPPSMILRGLPQTYAAVQLHFHWGSRGQAGGSEHQVNGEAFPAELHIVHYNSESYANVSEAKQQTDGLAVLGILIEVGDVANPAYDNILNRLKNIQYAGEAIVSIPPFDVHELLPGQLGHYFRYNGSLTTPPCSQNVLWTVFRQRARISASQVLAGRLQGGLYATKAENSLPVPLVDNYRAPQLLNQRLVFSSFPPGLGPHGALELLNICLSLLLQVPQPTLQVWPSLLRIVGLGGAHGVMFTADTQRLWIMCKNPKTEREKTGCSLRHNDPSL